MGNTLGNKFGIYGKSNKIEIGEPSSGGFVRKQAPSFSGMITKWTVSGDSLDVNLHGQEQTTFNYDVDWGDGQEETGITSDNKTHTYASAGTYTVKISGQFGGFRMGGSATPSALVEFVQWGTETTIEALYQMFSGCGNMVYSATDSPNIVLNALATYDTRVDQMFRYCTSVTSLDLSGWNIVNSNLVQLGTYCFDGCNNLEYLNVSGWSFPRTNASSFQYFFRNIGNLTANGCEFIWNNGTFGGSNFSYAFQGAKLKSFTMNNFTLNSSSPVNINNSFQSVEILDGNLDLSGWSGTSIINSMFYTFRNMNLASTVNHTVNFTGWDTSNVTTMYGLFYESRYVTDLIGLSDLRGGSLGSTGFNRTFYRAFNLTFDTYNFHDDFGSGWSVTDCNSCFFQMSSWTTSGSVPPNTTNWDTDVITGLNSAFKGFKFKASTTFTMFDIANCTIPQQMFQDTQGIVHLDMSNSNMQSGVTSMVNFVRSSDVETIDFSNCDFSGVATLSHFAVGTSLTSITFDATVSFASLNNALNFINSPGKMTTAEYDAFLVRLDTTGLTGAYTLTGGASNYTTGGVGETARTNLVTKGWSITDGGGV